MRHNTSGAKNLPKDFEALVDELKTLREAEEEAEKIVESAEREAEKMIQGTEEQSAAVMSEMEEEVRKAARAMREEADAEVKSETDNLEEDFISNIKEIKNKASKKAEEAVSYIFNQVLEAKA